MTASPGADDPIVADSVEEVPPCPRCGGVHPEMYESAAWDSGDDEEYPR